MRETGSGQAAGTGQPEPGQDGRRGRRWRISWRALVAGLLIVVGCVLAPVSVLAVWTATEVASTGRYVATVEPLAHNPAIQTALTDKITTAITSHLNVTGVTDQAAAQLSAKGFTRVGPLLKSFAPSVSGAITGYVHSAVHKIVTGPRFARVWVQANTIVHQELVKALSGQGGSSVKVRNGQVVLGLGPFISLVKQDLVKRGFTIVSSVPYVNPTLTLFSAKYLVKAQTGYRLINGLKIVLPILTLLLLALGVYVARGRRRALIGAGLGLAASMLVLGAGLLIARGILLNRVPNPAAAGALFDALVQFIKTALRTLLVLGLMVAAGAFLSGPSVTAVRTRHAFASGLGWLRASGEHAGLRTGPVGTWTYAHRKVLRIGAVALAALIFVFWGTPTAAIVILLTILLLVVLGLIELIGSKPRALP